MLDCVVLMTFWPQGIPMKNILAALALLASATVSGTAQASFFEPKDWEECMVQAAKDAKSEGALRILANQCMRDFPATRKPEGGYQYYDSSANIYIDVSGPKLSKNDWVIMHKA